MEAVHMPVAILVGQILAVAAYQLLAVLAGVGEEALVAANTVGVLLLQHVLPPEERALAVTTVKTLRHLGPHLYLLRNRIKSRCGCGVLLLGDEIVVCCCLETRVLSPAAWRRDE